MSFDILAFLRDHGINYRDDGHKHCAVGWVNIPCPFCQGNSGGWHLGFNLQNEYWKCWRCGWKNDDQVMKTLSGTSKEDLKKLRGSYRTRGKQHSKDNIQVRRVGKVKLPSSCTDLLEMHKKYLRGRNFDPDKLEEIWDLKGTGPIGSYKFRVIAPIYLQGKLISYQGRDITDKHGLKYKACPKEKELMDHKDSLYGFDQVPGEGVVVVEGITDVWRLGPGAVSTFGIEFKHSQIALLKNFKDIFILFDSEKQAQVQANKLASTLSAFNISVEILELESGDPADLADKDAKSLMKNLIL